MIILIIIVTAGAVIVHCVGINQQFTGQNVVKLNVAPITPPTPISQRKGDSHVKCRHKCTLSTHRAFVTMTTADSDEVSKLVNIPAQSSPGE